MKIQDEVLKAIETKKKDTIIPQVEITDSIRKAVVEALIDRKGGFTHVTLNANLDNIKDNQFFDVKLVRKGKWYRKARYEISYREKSASQLIKLLREEGVDCHVTDLGVASLTLTMRLVRDSYFPFTPILATEHKDTEKALLAFEEQGEEVI